MRVILDTNIIISALLNSSSPVARIVDEFADGRFILVTSEHQIEEIKAVSRYSKLKGRFKPSAVGDLINKLRHDSEVLPILNITDNDNISDKDDLFLIVMSEKSKSDYLVTGDKRAGLLQLGNIGRTKIITAAEFITILKL